MENEKYDQLRTLEALLKDGVIDEDEYNKKAVQIVSIEKAPSTDTINQLAAQKANGNKKISSKVILALGGIVCALLVIIAAVLTSSKYDYDWTYGKDDSRAIDLKGVTAYVPSEWDISKGYTNVYANGEDGSWFEIEYIGKFNSWDDFCNELAKSDLPIEGRVVDCEGFDKTLVVDPYYSDGNEHIYAQIALADGKGFWIGGGSQYDCGPEFKKMLDDCTYE